MTNTGCVKGKSYCLIYDKYGRCEREIIFSNIWQIRAVWKGKSATNLNCTAPTTHYSTNIVSPFAVQRDNFWSDLFTCTSAQSCILAAESKSCKICYVQFYIVLRRGYFLASNTSLYIRGWVELCNLLRGYPPTHTCL